MKDDKAWNPSTPKWSNSNFLHSLTRNITPHSMKYLVNFTVHNTSYGYFRFCNPQNLRTLGQSFRLTCKQFTHAIPQMFSGCNFFLVLKKGEKLRTNFFFPDYLQTIYDDPAVFRESLKKRHEKLHAAIPVGQEKHTANQLQDTDLTTGDVQQLWRKSSGVRFLKARLA